MTVSGVVRCECAFTYMNAVSGENLTGVFSSMKSAPSFNAADSRAPRHARPKAPPFALQRSRTWASDRGLMCPSNHIDPPRIGRMNITSPGGTLLPRLRSPSFLRFREF